MSSLSSNGNNALMHLAKVLRCELATPKQALLELVLKQDKDSTSADINQSMSQPLDEMSRLKRTTPIDCLRKINQAFTSQNNHPYSVFLCGLFSFDLIASFEQLPAVKMGNNLCPDYVFYLAEELLVIDHETQQCQIYSCVFDGADFDKNFYEQSRRLSLIAQKMTQGIDQLDSQQLAKPAITAEKYQSVACDLSDQAYADQVIQLKQNILAGDIFQVVPSRSFSTPCKDKLLAYQELKLANPSPYLFYLEDQDFTLFGASPESALKYQACDRKVELYPIAGTRARGKLANGEIDFDLDCRFEAELKLDQKEVAEHMMLVDLARNDISRISEQGSIKIPRLMQVDRYSHVMHLVSCVEGTLSKDLDCLHAYQACMNMGTLTGAPKIKATELLRRCEGKRRGSYGGAVGYINADGDMDTCIVIRSAYCRDGTAYIQAGAGVVHDSDPMAEADETRKKAGAVIEAVLRANELIEQGSLIKGELNQQTPQGEN
ncbi:MAG: anthranilate synthase component 1 [Enterobacterales bacterium]|nr:anthranilate synthase component 1 [Enterobacterales bacterium]